MKNFAKNVMFNYPHLFGYSKIKEKKYCKIAFSEIPRKLFLKYEQFNSDAYNKILSIMKSKKVKSYICVNHRLLSSIKKTPTYTFKKQD